MVRMMPRKARTTKTETRKKKKEENTGMDVKVDEKVDEKGDEEVSDVKTVDLKSGSTQDTSNERPPRFKFECQLCGKCCKTETVYITISDLDRWIKDNTIYRVMHLLDLEESEGRIRIYLRKDDDGKCSLYHRDNKQCTFYESRPLACRSFPLGYNGENYFLKSKNCKGLNKGKITKEELENIRNNAFEEHIASRLTDRVIPMLRGIFINKLLEQSQQFIDKLSEEQSDNESDVKQ
jgi:Fe-S-cluster containining protein